MTQRRFVLNRKKDINGISGTGLVAEGCVFSNGTTVICWQTEMSSTNVYQSIDDVEKIHSHEGATEIVWLDEKKVEKPFEWLLAKPGKSVI